MRRIRKARRKNYERLHRLPHAYAEIQSAFLEYQRTAPGADSAQSHHRDLSGRAPSTKLKEVLLNVILSVAAVQEEQRACPERSRRDLSLIRPGAQPRFTPEDCANWETALPFSQCESGDQ